MTERTDAQIIEEAAGYIDAGWCSNAQEDYNGNVCSIGALNKALFGRAYLTTEETVEIYGNTDDCAYKLREELNKEAEKWKNDPWGIVSWNDAQGRTQEEVSDLFKRTAKRLAAE